MKVGDRVRVVEESSRFIWEIGTILTSCNKGELLFVVFDDPTVTRYNGLHFLSYELEVVS